MQPSQVAARFPAVVDPLTQAAVAQVGAVAFVHRIRQILRPIISQWSKIDL